jgi:hypothetical protein
VAGGDGYVIDVQAEDEREDQSPLSDACHGGKGWLLGRTLRTSGFTDMIEWFSPGKRGI